MTTSNWTLARKLLNCNYRLVGAHAERGGKVFYELEKRDANNATARFEIAGDEQRPTGTTRAESSPPTTAGMDGVRRILSGPYIPEPLRVDPFAGYEPLTPAIQ